MILSKCDDMAGCGKTYPSDLNECPFCGAGSWASGTHPVDPLYYTFDIECLPNVFTCVTTHLASGTQWVHEISDRTNQGNEFTTFLNQLKECGATQIGYNNIHYDYPIIHFIMTNPWVTYREIYQKSKAIIESNDRFAHTVWESDHLIKQIDLLKIHHFDNPNKRTSLKALEVAMRMDNVTEFELDWNSDVSHSDKITLIEYNKHDVKATGFFTARSMPAIELRRQLSEKFNRSFMNYSDVKMGEVLLVQELEKQGIQCYQRVDGRRQPIQTIRSSINLGDIIFPYVRFERPEFNAILGWLRDQTITETKGVFAGINDPRLSPFATINPREKKIASEGKLHVVVDGLTYVLGTGGLHASVYDSIFESDDEFVIVDVDVASYYPNMGIANKLYPAHLGEQFCDAYLNIYQTRKSYPKGTPENAAYKLALNGAYGGSNNVYSPFFDSQYTMSITINGQLMLCMLAEQLIKTPTLKMIQCNTDGVTFRVNRKYLQHTRSICRWWEGETNLELEEAIYSKMCIRDVNSYAAQTESGKIKRIGAYGHQRPDENPGTREAMWHKDPSALVVPKAAEAALFKGVSVREFITNHRDPFDFMLRARAKGSDQINLNYPEFDVRIKQQKITRYFVSRTGAEIIKVAPPKGKPGTWKVKNKPKGMTKHQWLSYVDDVQRELEPYIWGLDGRELDDDSVPHDERIHTKNKSKHAERVSSECANKLVTVCNDVNDFDWSDVDYEYYISEAEKLVNPLTAP